MLMNIQTPIQAAAKSLRRIRRQIVLSLAVVALGVSLSGCKSSGSAQKGSHHGPAATGEAYKLKVLANNQTAKAVTGKMKINILAGDKDISLSGSLKMMRDDVIQLSLSVFGIEVGRMEFTRSDVLILDRVHRQYARVDYRQIDFLRSANLDFNALQAIFWNEIFIPGQADLSKAIEDIRVSESGDHTLLILSTAPRLDYSFLTVTKTAQLNLTTVKPKNVENEENLQCRYGSFVKLGGKDFPSSMKLTFKGDKTYTLDMALSSLNNDENWTKHTQVSSKYSELNVNRLLDKLMEGGF